LKEFVIVLIVKKIINIYENMKKKILISIKELEKNERGFRLLMLLRDLRLFIVKSVIIGRCISE